ncbi:hypothetical protein FRC12_017084 [Ceratobasidium sp. 428]|nr:hypothetical protein FRC12_017084 [Ceratobasidium sp. 428]
MEMKIDELRADVQGLRELLLERSQPVASSSRSPVRSHENYELEPVPPPQRKQKRRFEEILEQAPNETAIETPVENLVEKPAKQASRRKIPKSAARKREEKRVRQREKREKEREEKRQREQELAIEGGMVEGPIVVKEKSRKESRKESRKDKSSRTRPPAFVFNPNETPHFDTYSLSEQIHSLAEPAEPPADPETDIPALQIPIEKLPHALFLLVSESLPPSSRCSLDDLRVLWSGNSTARKVGEWTQIKIPYLHTAMMSAVVGKPTDARVGHRVFTMTDPRWPPTIQIPKLTSSIVAASVGLIKDPLSNTGAFVRDACTICDMQCPDTPLSWRRWLDKGKYDLETLPAMYKTQIQNMCGIPFAAFLRETKKKEKKR